MTAKTIRKRINEVVCDVMYMGSNQFEEDRKTPRFLCAEAVLMAIETCPSPHGHRTEFLFKTETATPAACHIGPTYL